MADTQANIRLVTTGGSESAAEISKASGALRNVTAASGGMEEKFQHRFQHIGLMLFAGDALRAAGLGRETRAVITAMNLALSGAQAAAGIASGGILLLVTAMAALAGIVMKVIQHQKDETEALNKTIDSTGKAAKAYEDEAKAIAAYEHTSGRATSSALALAAADRKVAEDIRGSQLAAYRDLITALNLKIAAEKDAASVEMALATVVNKVQAAHVNLLTTLARVGFWLQGKHFAASAEDVRKHQQAIDADTAALRKAEDAMRRLLSGNSQTYQEMAEAADKDAHHRIELDNKVTEYTKGRLKEVHSAYEEAYKEREKQAKAEAEKEKEIVKHMADELGNDVGHAFAQMVMEGKSFSETMTQAFRNFAEQAIQDIIRIEIEMMVLKALGYKGPVGGGGGGGGGGVFGGMFPTGGSRVVDRPTLFMAGDAGPELATFTPMGTTGPNAGGGGAGIQIGTVQTVVHGVNDPDKIADQVGDKIIQRIRGMGELNFTRG